MATATLKTGAGTLYYMAPEVLGAGPGGYDLKCDVFSLGVIFYQIFFF